MALFTLVALGLAGLCYLAVSRKPAAEGKLASPRLDRNVAEGVRLWNPAAGVDSMSFESCRIEKLRMGPFALGGMNVLCVKGLVLNLPLNAEDSELKSEEGRVKREEDSDAIAGLIPRAFLQRAGVPARRFSGIRITGLAVNRIENRLTKPVFAADELKNRGRALELSNCRVVGDDGRTNLVGKAQLILKPVPMLAWNGGKRRLDDLMK